MTTRVVTDAPVTTTNYRVCSAKCMQHNAVFSTTLGTTRACLYAEGNYKEYEADLHRRKGIDADTPHRIQYKKLVRS